jgi:hypothetical protein
LCSQEEELQATSKHVQQALVASNKYNRKHLLFSCSMSQLSFETRFSGENSQVFPSPEALRSPFTVLQWTFLDQDGCQWHLATDVRLGH